MPQGIGGKSHEDQRTVTSVVFLGVQWSGSCQETSSQVKDNIFHLAPPTTRKEAQTWWTSLALEAANTTLRNTAPAHTPSGMKCFVNPKNKMAGYFTSKMRFWGNRREIAIQDKQTLPNHRQVQRDGWGLGEGQLLLGFRRKLERLVLNKSSLEKNKCWRLWQVLIATRGGCCIVAGAGRDLLSFLLKSRRETPMWKNASPRPDNPLSSFLGLRCSQCRTAPPSGFPGSVSNEEFTAPTLEPGAGQGPAGPGWPVSSLFRSEVGVFGTDAVWSSWSVPVGESQPNPLGFFCAALPSAREMDVSLINDSWCDTGLAEI